MRRRDFLATVAGAAVGLPAPLHVDIRQGEGSQKRALAGATGWTNVMARKVGCKTRELTIGPFPAGIPLAQYRAADGVLVTSPVLVTRV